MTVRTWMELELGVWNVPSSKGVKEGNFETTDNVVLVLALG